MRRDLASLSCGGGYRRDSRNRPFQHFLTCRRSGQTLAPKAPKSITWPSIQAVGLGPLSYQTARSAASLGTTNADDHYTMNARIFSRSKLGITFHSARGRFPDCPALSGIGGNTEIQTQASPLETIIWGCVPYSVRLWDITEKSCAPIRQEAGKTSVR